MASAAAPARRTFFMRTSIERLHKDGRAPRRNQLTDWKECAVLPRCNLPPFCGRAYLFRSDGYRGNQVPAQQFVDAEVFDMAAVSEKDEAGRGLVVRLALGNV